MVSLFQTDYCWLGVIYAKLPTSSNKLFFSWKFSYYRYCCWFCLWHEFGMFHKKLIYLWHVFLLKEFFEIFTTDTNIFCIYGLFGIFHNIFFWTLDCVRLLGKNLVRFGCYVLKDMFTNAFLCSCFFILFCGLGNLSFSKMLDELRIVEICNKRNFAHELKYKSLFLLSHSCNNTLYFICITSSSVPDIKT